MQTALPVLPSPPNAWRCCAARLRNYCEQVACVCNAENNFIAKKHSVQARAWASWRVGLPRSCIWGRLQGILQTMVLGEGALLPKALGETQGTCTGDPHKAAVLSPQADSWGPARNPDSRSQCLDGRLPGGEGGFPFCAPSPEVSADTAPRPNRGSWILAPC